MLPSKRSTDCAVHQKRVSTANQLGNNTTRHIGDEAENIASTHERSQKLFGNFIIWLRGRILYRCGDMTVSCQSHYFNIPLKRRVPASMPPQITSKVTISDSGPVVEG
ncbi:hypothetical protein AVEN_170677-1 [Araneus ventricosus]|uniref:Uncharacterized protein n=1 Tax=Araneus ventricosus TaxID=182803 RepID=A0A4Y2SBR8_ARAVE|nr:hypothetical protein AVEN_170677-1 [Araneus ventricosus]